MERKKERSGPKIERSGAECGASMAKNDGAGAERGAGGRGAGTERGARVTEIGWSVERLFRRSRSAHML